MNKLVSKVISSDVGTALRDFLAQARRRVVIVAPFIRANPLSRVMSGIGMTVPVLIITRWRTDEIAMGVSDPSILELSESRSHVRIVLQPRLHAKVYMVDDAKALIGSANVTELALGYAVPPNEEILVELEPVPSVLVLFVHRLERTGVVASRELREKLEEAARRLAPESVTAWQSVEMQPFEALLVEGGKWLPTFRAPDRLYEAYVSLGRCGFDEDRGELLDDLAQLWLPDGLNEIEFLNEVGKRLLSYELVAGFDEFVARPRRFGELTDWLKKRMPELGGDLPVYQRRVQTLIRWLLFFLSDRYRLAQLHYSEIFGRRDGFTDAI